MRERFDASEFSGIETWNRGDDERVSATFSPFPIPIHDQRFHPILTSNSPTTKLSTQTEVLPSLASPLPLTFALSFSLISSLFFSFSFLNLFALSSCLLNAPLPLSSACSFNRAAYSVVRREERSVLILRSLRVVCGGDTRRQAIQSVGCVMRSAHNQEEDVVRVLIRIETSRQVQSWMTWRTSGFNPTFPATHPPDFSCP